MQRSRLLAEHGQTEGPEGVEQPLTAVAMHAYWGEAAELTRDFDERGLPTVGLIGYLNKRLPAEGDPATRTKINYLRDQGVLKPERAGGTERINWRYTRADAQRAIVIELLRLRHGLGVQESKGWVASYEQSQGRVIPEAEGQTERLGGVPTPVSMAYALLRNRTMGALITALGQGEADLTPRGCLIGVRRDTPDAPPIITRRFGSWKEMQELADASGWHLAFADATRKLYIYRSMAQLLDERPEIKRHTEDYRLYHIPLQSQVHPGFAAIIGLPDVDAQLPSSAAILETLDALVKAGVPVETHHYPGLSSLLQAAFAAEAQLVEGGPLATLAELMVMVISTWDYCAILVPDDGQSRETGSLRVQEHSAGFPRHLRQRLVKNGQFLSGWSYRYGQRVLIAPTVEADPRVAFYDDERPQAALAVPAICEDDRRRTVGVIYFGRKQRPDGGNLSLTEEERASLAVFGRICGDMISRDQIETSTVRSLARIVTPRPPQQHAYASLHELASAAAVMVRRGVSPDKLARSWMYLLTLNIQTPSQNEISRWLFQQAVEVTADFLANRISPDPAHQDLPVGTCMVRPGQFVLAIMQPVDVTEETFKRSIIALRTDLAAMRVGQSSAEFYPWGISFRYDDLQAMLNASSGDLTELTEHLHNVADEALIAGPYISRGHDALRVAKLDLAVSEFRDSLRYTPNNWYVLKHLAEARMLQGLPLPAIQQCGEALRLNPRYASARCLLADCLAYLASYGEAIISYEAAIELNPARPDFLERYGFALASMSQATYDEACAKAQGAVPLRSKRFRSAPHLEAIDKFEQALRLYEGEHPHRLSKHQADYHCRRGHAYLQAGMLDEAVEDFEIGRRLAPDDPELARAYAYTLSLVRRRGNVPGALLQRQPTTDT